ncbi:hypothetical protein AWJ20_3740 [Sugiyamaella lignohabitans]|uniref:BZIP domain-containing protein n=1 Tax=Sugiyamaella lignohabitans TaxID=796027 RepID=A0A167BXH0_9ASCO|nr:uncharacterized protein AWJ20_3740 [Sugiyamaella lignohabitans]ANB10946.1 hypothetical protein AWJ20_3740 [Sugiyamaella lignohabitans]
MVKIALAPAPPQPLASKRPVAAGTVPQNNVPRIAAKKPLVAPSPRAVLSAAASNAVSSIPTNNPVKPVLTTASALASSTRSRTSVSAASPVAVSSPTATAASSPVDTTGAAPVSKISTSKVWVLPPRPKPGRKPSVDTPQNKRKAQNRAAQRAFRERRAAMVGELEEKLNELTKERDAREARLEAQLKAVTRENENLKRSVRDMQAQLAKQNVSYQMASPPMSSHESPMDILDRVLEERLPVPDKSRTNSSSDACGVCIKDDCICESVGIKARRTSNQPVSAVSMSTTRSSISSITGTSSAFKTNDQSNAAATLVASSVTAPAVSLKRNQPESNDDEPYEIDFTEMFSRPAKKQAPPLLVPSPVPVPKHRTSSTRTVLKPPADRCGFCSDGNPCMCAEAEAEAQAAGDGGHFINDIEEDNTLPPIVLNNMWSSSYQNTNKLPALHPGPSREVPPSQQPPSPQVALPAASVSSITAPSYECTGNPGTCMQCQTDPMSTLFCTTLASRPEKGDSEKKKAVTTPSTPTEKTRAGSSSFISASAAYRTLSRHKDFRSADFGALVGKLNTRGMQVEVNSVANVLRELDRKLYSS